jgi:hypothetical protein
MTAAETWSSTRFAIAAERTGESDALLAGLSEKYMISARIDEQTRLPVFRNELAADLSGLDFFTHAK